MTFMRRIMDALSLNAPTKSRVAHDSAKWQSIKDPTLLREEVLTVDLKNVTIYFHQGLIISIVPDVYDYYKAQYYDIDGKIFDTYSLESVNSIPIMDLSKRKSLGTPVYYLEYILGMRASQERKNGNNVLAYALLRKSTELMKCTGTFYGEKDFLRLVNWLYQDGKLQEAQQLEEELRIQLPLVFDRTLYHVSIIQKNLDECKRMKTDYIFCSSHPGTCSECAKYQCRVYCISGKDKRFPKLPEIVKQYGGFHPGCIHSFYPHFLEISDTISDHNLKKYDVFEYSNRPFIDDRTKEDRLLYQERLENRKKHEESAYNKKIYYILKEKIPEVMPKSLAGFTKMKRANSINYQKIVKYANEIGIDIRE